MFSWYNYNSSLKFEHEKSNINYQYYELILNVVHYNVYWYFVCRFILTNDCNVDKVAFSVQCMLLKKSKMDLKQTVPEKIVWIRMQSIRLGVLAVLW
jgi:hypothetical protein